jgi:hypothetical protein
VKTFPEHFLTRDGLQVYGRMRIGIHKFDLVAGQLYQVLPGMHQSICGGNFFPAKRGRRRFSLSRRRIQQVK